MTEVATKDFEPNRYHRDSAVMLPESWVYTLPQSPEVSMPDFSEHSSADCEKTNVNVSYEIADDDSKPSSWRSTSEASMTPPTTIGATDSSPESRPVESNGIHDDIKAGPSDGFLLSLDLPPASEDPVIMPFEYVSALPSKGVRGKLISALNVWVEASPESLSIISSVVADCHNLSLILDDVQDNSPMRRGKPATHSVFGMPQAINSAVFQVVDVISRVRSLGDSEALTAVIDEMKNLLIGQGHDLGWTNLVSAPTVDEYLRMVDGKTGGLFRMISRLLIALSQSPSKPADLDRLMTLFGRFFQIRDDYANLTSDQYTKEKGFCEDLDEGKYSFILIHALENGSPRLVSLLQNMLIQRRAAGSAPPGHKEFILTILEEIGSLDYTAEALRNLQIDIEEELRLVEKSTGKSSPVLWKVLEALRV